MAAGGYTLMKCEQQNSVWMMLYSNQASAAVVPTPQRSIRELSKGFGFLDLLF